MNTPMVDRAADYGSDLGQANEWASQIWPLARRLERDRAELVEALLDYMSQFGQALDAHGIPYGKHQEEADKSARALLARIEADK